MELNRIYNMDCLAGMKEMPDESVDLVVTDPPYKIMPKGNNGSMGGMYDKKETMLGDIFEYNGF